MENVKLLKDYARFLVKISKTYQPIIVAGGGKIARHYITHARSSGADESTLDELGIEISRLNAKLLIYALKDKAYPHPPTTLREAKHAVDSGLIVVAGGYDLMDIVALKIIERSKIKTRVIRSDIKTLEKAGKGGSVGTEIILSKK